MLHLNLRRYAVLLTIFGCFTASTEAHAASSFVVSFRLPQWKTAHFHDAAKAKAHYDTLAKLGCQVKSSSHGDHLDVTYRCADWRSLSVQTDAGAHQWERWLRASGFETAHEH